MNNVISRNGALYCFCELAIKGDYGLDRFKNFKFEYNLPDGSIGIEEAPICKVYYHYMTGFGYALEQGFSYLVVILSFVIRSMFIYLAEKVRFFSLTKETKFVMVSVFWITFINYGIIYLAASWDMRDSVIPLWNKLFSGLYPDFNALWFNDVGVLVVAIMMSNMYWPPLEFFMMWGIRLLYRMIDQRSLCPTNQYNTRCKTI